MKNHSTFIIMFFLAFSVFSQDCNIGNSNADDPNFTPGNILPDYILGISFTLSEVGVLNSLNIIGNGTGATFKMALYDDNNGIPNNLITYTENSTVGSGIISCPVEPVQLEAGNYWIMAVYKDDGSGTNHVNVNINDSTRVVYYTDLVFGNPIPTNASSFETYNGHDLLYFAEISCGLLSTINFEVKTLSIYPNPASDYIVIDNLEKTSLFTIFDVTGKKLIQSEVSESNNQITINQLKAGTYFLTNGDMYTTRFIKN